MKKTVIICLFTLLTISLQAQQTLSIESLWQLKRLSEPALSPDGKNIIYALKTYDVHANKGSNSVYVQAIASVAKPAHLISGADDNAFDIRWRPDGKKITFLSAKTGEVQLWEMNPDGSDKHAVSSIAGGISGYKYSPDLKHVAYTADVKLDQTVKEKYPDLDKCNARIIDGLMYRHWDSWHDYAYSHLFVITYLNGAFAGDAIDIQKGEKADCPLQPNGDDDEFCWSPDSRFIAYDCKKENGTAEALSTNSDIYVYSLSDGTTRNLSEANKGYDRNPSFSPDGSKLAWLQMRTPSYESDLNELVVLPFSNGTASGDLRRISDQTEMLIENFQWLHNTSILTSLVKEGTKPIYRFDQLDKPNVKVILVSGGNCDYTSIAAHDISSPIIAARMSISAPTDLVQIDPKSGAVLPITHVNEDVLKNIEMGNVTARWVTASDGKKILNWIIYPPHFDPSKKYPTLLYCQGGPQSPVSQFFSYRWNFQLMAAKGYIVVAPNRRGLPGFGKAWNDEIANDYGGQCMRDYLSSIDDMKKEPYVDANRLGAVGASFGGYSVYWLAGNHEKRFKCFIAHCGMFNMESWYGTTEELFFANHDNGGPYWSQTAHPNNFDASPHKFIQNWDTPILVIHNEKDFRVPLGQGMEAFTAAQVKGIPSRFLYFPDENHWVTKPQNSVLWQRVFFEWLDTYLK